MRQGAQGQTDQGSRLFEPQASLRETPAGPSTAGCPERSVGTQEQGRLFLAYFLLAKQKKVSRPPRRQSGTGPKNRTETQLHKRRFDKPAYPVLSLSKGQREQVKVEISPYPNNRQNSNDAPAVAD
jgi:hypothetical protein